MDILTGAIISAIIALFVYFWFSKNTGRLPPYPVKPLPIVGHLFALVSDQRSKFMRWREECGDIFCLQLGSKILVVLNGYDLIKEALVHKAEDFTDRPYTVLDKMTRLPQAGVITSTGRTWNEHRSVSLQILCHFGFGKNILAERIQEEVSFYINSLSGCLGRATDIKMMTTISTSNIICSIMFGQRFDYNDPSLIKLTFLVDSLFRTFQLNGVVNFIPVLQYLPGDLFHLKKFEADVQEMLRLLSVFIEDCRDGNKGDNLVTEYLQELSRRKKNGADTTMCENGLKRLVFDFFNAGTETTSTTIDWFVLYMLHHPDVQKKVFDEINEHVGTEREPNIRDKQNLTYLNAAIMETQRLASIAPYSLVRTCPRDVNIRGYTIPKGAYITPSLDSVLHDAKIWGNDVMSFRPERFIDQEGKLLTPEQFVPFALGKRDCLGESMAKTELFLYLSNMFQKFEFRPTEQGNPPPLKYHLGVTAVPLPYDVTIVSRLE
ncbi:cytochrome P450 18a1 [Biomphalaria pfeifferi]|uniref:Cytochrome P450 18a1 n=1 Tax=Biomphalaria pfeifferi TaxID=112525 RepID=A0AAD8EXG0_BIOPF|nr:cytochrome P450 18a1 [Biomphalaria pfeifferi]